MKIVIDTTMGRHMLEVTSDDAMAVAETILFKYGEDAHFLPLW